MNRRAFTLIELLVVIAIIALLVSILVPAVIAARNLAKNAYCLTQLTNIGKAFMLYAEDSNTQYPRSGHSAAKYHVLPWEQAVIPYLGGGHGDMVTSSAGWNAFYNGVLRCPMDQFRDPWNTTDSTKNRLSFAMNNYYELEPSDDYVGNPTTWRTLTSVPRPQVTVLLVEVKSGTMSSADHIMPECWWDTTYPIEVDTLRHVDHSNYIFADGHAQGLVFQKTYDPTNNIDRYNPGLAW